MYRNTAQQKKEGRIKFCYEVRMRHPGHSGLCMDKGVLIAPNVTISTTNHLMHYKARTHGEMYCKKVVIEDYVWIGSNVVISAGVMIGKGSVIGAGSVVTRDVPPVFCSRRTL